MPDDELTFYCDSCGQASKFSKLQDATSRAGFNQAAILRMWSIPTCYACGSTYGAIRPEDTQMAARGRIRLDTIKRYGLGEHDRQSE